MEMIYRHVYMIKVVLDMNTYSMINMTIYNYIHTYIGNITSKVRDRQRGDSNALPLDLHDKTITITLRYTHKKWRS